MSWEVGANVPDSMFYDLRQGILLVEQYVRSLDVPELDDEVVFYLYWDPVPAMARAYGISEQQARQSYEAHGHAGEENLAKDGSGAIFKDASRIHGSPRAHLTHGAAHSLFHMYQFFLPEQRGFRLDHTVIKDHYPGPAWLLEGQAEFSNLRAMARGGVYLYDTWRNQFAQTAVSVDTSFPALETYKRLLEVPGSYELGAMAVELLAAEAGEEAVLTYWTLLSSETLWKEAFRIAFGMTVDEFYRFFAEHRAAGFPDVGLPEIDPSLEDLPQLDRPALVAFYNATGGANWMNNSNWLSDAHISQWHGVTINPAGRVTELRLTENRLGGRLPSELGSLTELRVLSLWANGLTGPISSELAHLSRLEELGLGGNRFGGEIPSWLRSLSNLRELHLPSNQFTGRIPSWIGDLGLRGLYLADNRLSGDIPAELGNLSDLQSLWLGGNNLTGCIPDELRDVPYNDFAETGLPFCGQ